ncbi:Ail/Lom family outer membrane beta-barrel protein [Acinetobacter faecalis]|uniref:Ail/Lom family outer membrane beta-barrel protein n=1 Tax=Acinetobacter faecalis TaxID=2665161 RepID=UPI002A91DCAF|nr:Ail/Lom family outer membrane beta-barrel protein [Acinetobacter faecalis]MDY6461988.1 Ail/Lom family outer membrane beta-barrel protein [Acinetobacter faecalis]
MPLGGHFYTAANNSIEKGSETGFAYGVGLTVNPIQNIAINVGYEGTNVDSTRFNGFNVGVGYRF